VRILVQVWDLQEGVLFYTLHGHDGPTLGVDFSPAGNYFASAGADGQVMTWRTNFDACLASAVAAVAVPGGKAACTASASRGSRPLHSVHSAWRPAGARGLRGGDAAGPTTLRPKTAPAQPAGPLQRPAEAISAAQRSQQHRQMDLPQQEGAAGALVDAAPHGGSPLDAGLAGLLQQLVLQLDMLTQVTMRLVVATATC